jgi:hypothetical protein
MIVLMTLLRADVISAPRAEPSPQVPPSAPGGDLLLFLDGSSLHGRLQAIQPSRGVTWKHPDARQLIELRHTNLAWIRFEHSLPITNRILPDCRFRFRNGDEIPGRLTGMDAGHVEFQTWFGNRIRAPRGSLHSLTFSARGYDVLYEGPNGMEDWKQSRGQPAWQFRDGAFIARSVGTIGRDFNLPDRSSFSFDIAWNNPFNLMVTYYTSAVDRFDYTTSSYMVSIGYGYISIQRVQPGAGSAMLGQVLLQDMRLHTRMRVELRASRPDNLVALLVDGVLVNKWKDPSGFAGGGPGIAFLAQQNGPSVRVSNIRLAEWDGRFEFDTTPGGNQPPAAADQTFLVNHDRALGNIGAIQDGKMSVALGTGTINIPLTRVTHVLFAAGTNAPPSHHPWDIRGYFAHGGRVSFQLDEWTEARVTGHNASLGTFAFDTRSLRQMQFNLDRSDRLDQSKDESGDDFWEADE